jgi:hypothetical protein
MSLGWPYGHGFKDQPAKARDPGAVTPSSLRDWFAGQALTAILTRRGDLQADDLGKLCYRYADGMMTARENR